MSTLKHPILYRVSIHLVQFKVAGRQKPIPALLGQEAGLYEMLLNVIGNEHILVFKIK